ncbi:hypothetical protein GIB67_010182 [Kingdonia uniflora]|uniref:RING-type E3 ubiquitin transferase n=1 Tax=Kingdonia uniflora TaxID=39325 RepID=A0A7J7NB68_9MAGN|nr:hypothetical protein GIB67_010182 [Kingdonia uniflora]
MNQEEGILFRIFPVIFFVIFSYVEAQNSPSQANTSTPDIGTSFRPSVAIVIGILSIMFSLTFLLLIYAKFCHATPPDVANPDTTDQNRVLIRTRSTRFSGIDKTVIESLPFFRFSSLKGSRKGLECSVCLSKFEDTEILRLLPKCKHAFHISCVDQWLESHSSCPLCRFRVDPEDHSIFTCSNSLRFSGIHSDLTNDLNLELFVRREEDDHGSSRFSVGSSFRKIEKGEKEEILLNEDDENIKEDKKLLRKFKHKIILSDVIVKNRWSDVNSSDFMFMNSEMLNAMSSKRFTSASSSTHENTMKTKEAISSIDRSNSASGPSGSKFMVPSGKRSMSEIINLPRFEGFGMRSRSTKESPIDGNIAREERMKELWFPIARRTLQWFAGREKKLNQSQYSRQLSIV